MTPKNLPPMDPNTDEATQKQLDLACAQGDAYGNALEYMTGTVAHDGGETEAGNYRIGYAVEKVEGMYELVDGDLAWREPGDANPHLEVSVRDRADGRNGQRFTRAEEATFTGVDVERGQGWFLSRTVRRRPAEHIRLPVNASGW